MALERGTIVAAALRLLDEVGLDGLTLRRLATDLGVQAPALYWHFKNKQELLDAMAAAMSSAHPRRRPLDDPARWREWIADYARGERAMLNSHRDGARLAAGTKPTDEMFGLVELAVEALERAGFAAADAFSGLFAVTNFVAGFTLEEQAERTRPDTDDHPDLVAFQARYPRMMAWLIETGDPQGDDSFEASLALILDGMSQRLAGAGT
ncbi:TetR/AcrR family transcriptional regulator C-terminal domain-containing protein [Nonomuraea sp. NPDC000554]|uniref:TetR/AcrR family transcriptional regulator C-terminal domain-containing protein n=1 Tax=Nonomuraea sp. NPDC000554 TaxID=3154259 RepID=UPI0033331FBB